MRQTINQENNKLLVVVSAFIFFITVIGFYPTYFGKIRAFHELPTIMHLHAVAFLIWMTLLIIQPLLILKKKVSLHRKVGKLSFFIVSILAITAIGMIKIQYKRLSGLGGEESEILAQLCKPMIDILVFVVFL